ncbi:unnamed protein product [Euphydryas editha]|uniref:DDE Tnp4 domain-containing protein n=1 Tax=Euphydryas editha TaxID=104508 RepID=A0AAU9UWA0_EUPED|nr:unnamed protein product [Euphydryas editha]
MRFLTTDCVTDTDCVAENAFGLLNQVFRVFYTPIAVLPSTCTDLILVACCLHNLLRDAYLEENSRPHYVRDENENPTGNMIHLTGTRGQASDGTHIREYNILASFILHPPNFIPNFVLFFRIFVFFNA